MDRRFYSGVDGGGGGGGGGMNRSISMSELISFSNDNKKGSMEDVLYGKEDHQEFNNSYVYRGDVVESMRSEIESKELKRKMKKKQNMFWSFFQSCFEFLRILATTVAIAVFTQHCHHHFYCRHTTLSGPLRCCVLSLLMRTTQRKTSKLLLLIILNDTVDPFMVLITLVIIELTIRSQYMLKHRMEFLVFNILKTINSNLILDMEEDMVFLHHTSNLNSLILFVPPQTAQIVRETKCY